MSSGVKLPPNDLPLWGWFFAYAVGTVVLFVSIPLLGRLLAPIPPMPWEYWWVFLFVTPLLPAVVLVREARAGRFSWVGVVVFLIVALTLGAFYRWFSYDLSGVV